MINYTDSIKRILTNHPQSTLEGLIQVINGDPDSTREAVEQLIEEGWLTTGQADWGGTVWVVYKKKKTKKP